MQAQKKVENLLLVGCGDIAQRLAGRLLDADGDYSATGLRRRPPVTGQVMTELQFEVCDLARPEQLESALSRRPYDVVVITLTPDEYSEAGYRRTYGELLDQFMSRLERQSYRPRLVIFVSSTSVYGQCGGEWVDEDSVTEPRAHAGRELLRAEARMAASPLSSCVVRFSGIYGPGRKRLIEQVREGVGCAETPPSYTNRIHADDAAGFLAHLIERQRLSTEALATCYLASDSEPVPMWQVKQWLAARLGLVDHWRSQQPTGRRGSKRCSNQRLLATGYRLRYPDFRRGYSSLL